MRLGRGVIWAVLGLVSLPAALWGAGALHFTGPRPAALADGLAVLLVVVVLGVLVRVRPLGRTLVALAIGAVTPGRAMTQASATCDGVAPCAAATSSSAARMDQPRSLK